MHQRPLHYKTGLGKSEDIEEVEMPDKGLVVQRFLGRPGGLVETASQEFDQPSSEDSQTESVLRTLHRINMICLDPVDLMVVPVNFKGSDTICQALIDSGAEVNLVSSDSG